MELPAKKDGPLLADLDSPAGATLVARLKAGDLKAFETIVRPYSGHLVPAAIRAELNADTDRDVLIRMRHLARKKRMRKPEITDEEMADYLALAENCANFEHWFEGQTERHGASCVARDFYLAAQHPGDHRIARHWANRGYRRLGLGWAVDRVTTKSTCPNPEFHRA